MGYLSYQLVQGFFHHFFWWSMFHRFQRLEEWHTQTLSQNWHNSKQGSYCVPLNFPGTQTLTGKVNEGTLKPPKFDKNINFKSSHTKRLLKLQDFIKWHVQIQLFWIAISRSRLIEASEWSKRIASDRFFWWFGFFLWWFTSTTRLGVL